MYQSSLLLKIRPVIQVLVSCLLWLYTPTISAQQGISPVRMSFLKSTDELSASQTFFNVLKVVNTSDHAVKGNLILKIPDKWSLLSTSQGELELLPGDSIALPLRISPDINTVGGISYLLNAAFKTGSYNLRASANMKMPSRSKWDMLTNSSNLYFTEFSPFADFKIKLTNTGNTNELIRVHLKIGKLLSFERSNNSEYIEFVRLPAYRDTVITYAVSYQSNLNDQDKIRYERNWRESAIQITATTEDARKSAAISIEKLNSSFENIRAQNSSPLNFDYQTYNIMSNQPIRSNLRMYGSILFPENHDFQYMVGVQNYDYGQSGRVFDPEQQMVYSLRYSDRRNELEVGYNVGGGNLHSVSGRGINGRLKVTKNNVLAYTFVQNPYTHSVGEALSYNFLLGKLALTTGLTNEQSTTSSYMARSGLVGMGLTLFKHHSLGVQFLGSQVRMDKVRTGDTLVRGFTYKADYTIRYKHLDFRVSGMSSSNNYIRSAGMEQLYVDGRYMFSENGSLVLYGSRLKYSSSRYPYNFYNPVSFNTSDYVKLTASLTSGKVTYQLGPSYIGSERQYYNSSTGYRSDYMTQQPGLWLSSSVKISSYRTIAPNVTVSNLRFKYLTQDPLGLDYASTGSFSYSAGVSYYDPHWRVNAYYTSGATSDLYRSLQVSQSPAVTRTLQVRPSYENYYFDRKVRFSAYVNYIYYMPSGRENTSVNLRYDHFFKYGWSASLSGFMYSNVRMDDEVGRISTKDINMLLGITKSFNIQQPRLKYYDLKVVFFNDLDGNRIKTDNEPPVSNIKVNIEKDRLLSGERSNMASLELLSNVNGEVSVTNLPKDNYRLSMTPLVNLETLYFVDGSEQSYFNDRERTIYVPLAESFKIKGRVLMERDANSNEGRIDLGSIRITAASGTKKSYSALTASDGSFVIAVPNADQYSVHVNNVFGENFSIDADEQIVQFTDVKTINVDFLFVEQKRGIVFDNAGGYNFKFGAPAGGSADEIKAVPNKISATAPSTYAIELMSSQIYTEPEKVRKKYKLSTKVNYTVVNGEYHYYTGDYSSLLVAKKAMTKSAIKGTVVPVNRSDYRSVPPIPESKNSLNQKTMQSATKPVSVPLSTGLQFFKSNVQDVDADTIVSKKANKSTLTYADVKPLAKTGAINTGQLAQPNKVAKVLPAKEPGVLAVEKATTKQLESPTEKPKVTMVVPPAQATKEEAVLNPQELNDPRAVYTIRLDGSDIFASVQYLREKYKLPYAVYLVEKDGHKNYYMGKYATEAEAKADIVRYGVSGYIVPYTEAYGPKK